MAGNSPIRRTYSCDHNPQPICPHCGTTERDAWEIDFSHNEDRTHSCGSCGRDYRVTRHMSVTYSTSREVPDGK